MKTYKQLLGVLLLAAVPAIPQYAVKPFAGGGPNNIAGPNFPLDRPSGLAYNAVSGDLYVALEGTDRVYKMTPSGVMVLVAGSGKSGMAGDGGGATAASFYNPQGIALDSAGNLYIADRYNYRIRKVVAATGAITTIAGNGVSGYSGDGGLATSAKLYEPAGVAVDSAGNVYIADSRNSRVRKIAAGTNIITTVAGNGTAGFSGDGGLATAAGLDNPDCVAIGPGNNVYICDADNNRVRKIDVASGVITTVAGNGASSPVTSGVLATSGVVNGPRGVTFDGSGNMYISENNGWRVRKVNGGTGIMTTLAGDGSSLVDGGPATSSSLASPFGIAVDGGGNVFVASWGANRIRRVAAAGTISTVAGNGETNSPYFGDGGNAVDAVLNNPYHIARSNTLDIYISDRDNHAIRKVVNATGGKIETLAGNGTAGFSGDGGLAVAAQLKYPSGVAVDADGNVYIADQGNDRVRKVAAATGVITTFAGAAAPGYSGDGGSAIGAALDTPEGLAVDSSGNLYIADYHNHRIRRVQNGTGIITTIAGNGTATSAGDGGLATAASIRYPIDVAVGGTNLYIAEYYGNRVRVVNLSTGIITTAAGTGSYGFSGDGGLANKATMSNPSGVAVDGIGNLLITDSANHVIRRVRLDTGIIDTIAGTGVKGYGGDGGPGPLATFGVPSDIEADARGNAWVVDQDNDRVRLLVPPCAFRLDPDSLSISQAGGELTTIVRLLSGDACTWSVASNTTWITVLSGSAGSGEQTVRISVQPNAGAARSGTVTIAGLTLTVQQTSPACAATIAPTSMTLGENGGKLTVAVVPTGASCTSWTASSSVPWIQVYPLSGNGVANIELTVVPNFGTTSRTATATIGGQVFTLTELPGTGTSLRRFIRMLYYYYFGRVPTEAEVNFHAGGGLTRENLAYAFYNSTEFNVGGRFVAGLYVGLLDRDAEYGGWLFQRNALASNIVAQADLVQNFLNSAEYKLKFGSPTLAEYVRLLYRYILLREATQAEVDFHVSTGLTRVAMAQNFLNSNEFRVGTGPRLTTFLLHATLLQRDASADERRAMMNLLTAGTPVLNLVTTIVGSAEFNNALN